MSEAPKTIENGEWIRRDALVAEFAEEEGLSEDYVDNTIVMELVEAGPVRTKEHNGAEYIQLTSLSEAMRFIARTKVSMKMDRMRSLVGWGGR